MNTETPQNPKRPDKPAFLVGITGSRDINPAALKTVEDQVRTFFRWLRDGGGAGRSPVALGKPLGLSEQTDIIVLSSLAPGADQVVARIAMEDEFDFHVSAPLPFAKDQYARSTAFTKEDGSEYEKEREFLEKFPTEDTFVVPLQRYNEWSEDQIRRHHESASVFTKAGSKSERDACYRAAGEVVAAYAQILLVLTPDMEQAPTLASPGAVGHAKLNGLSTDAVLGTPALTWADTGIVVHIATPKTEAVAVTSAGTMSVFQPDDGQRNDSGHGLFTLRRTADWLNLLNKEESSVDPAIVHAEFSNALQWPIRADQQQATSRWACVWKRFKEQFHLGREEQRGTTEKPHLPVTPLVEKVARRIARVRRRVALYNRHYDVVVRSSTELFIALGFFSVMVLAFAENFVPASYEGDHRLDPWLLAFFWLAVVSVGLAILFHLRFRFSRATEKQDDYRALAEGFRVQLYWTVAGLRRSAATHYMVRQRGELSWLRSAMRSVSFPFWGTHWAFMAQPWSEQLEALRCVRENWLREQERYFSNSEARMQRVRHLLHIRRNLGLFIGLFLALAQAHTDRLECFAKWIQCVVCCWELPVRAAWILLIIVLCVVVPLVRWWRECDPDAKPAGHHHLTPQAEWRHKLKHETLPLSAIALLIASVITLGVFDLAGLTKSLPEGHRMLAILRNAAFTYAGVNHLWSGLRFLTENIRRYDAMRELYFAAGKRLDGILSAPIDEGQKVAQSHALLFALGREALQENAEWLGMHRDRPIEPVLPGA